jgi:hypothetical protein
MRRLRPSPAVVIACLALLIALGGTAVATGRYVITAIGQIKPNVLGVIRTPGPDLPRSGPKVIINPGKHINLLRAECPPGYHVVAGGYFFDDLAGGQVIADEPDGTTGWLVIVNSERSTKAVEGIARALCAPGRVPLPTAVK